jgi:hypothetical protein
LAFFFVLAFFAFFAFFAFLAIVSSQGFNGLKRDSEACLAEGQPRNILTRKLNRFAGRCRVLSRRCHRVIHSCYAFDAAFVGIFPAADLSRRVRDRRVFAAPSDIDA